MGGIPSRDQYFYKNAPVNITNYILVGTYEHTKHYFKYVDRNEFFKELVIKQDGRERSGCSAALLKLNNVNYRKFKDNNYCWFKYAYYTVQYKLNEEIERGGDILAGLYFPNNEIGDEIDIMANDIVISTIKITDTNKIYLPLDDLYFIILLHAQGPTTLAIKCKQKQNLTYYVVFLLLDSCPRRTLCTHCGNYKIELKKQIIYFTNCRVYLKYSNNEKSLDCLPNGQSLDCLSVADYPQMLAAMQIQRAWRRYKHREKYDWKEWNNNIEFVNDDIKYIPGLGIEYFNSLDSYELNKLKLYA